jgi:hypothetical protein
VASVRANQIAHQTSGRGDLELAALFRSSAKGLTAEFNNEFSSSNLSIAYFL